DGAEQVTTNAAHPGGRRSQVGDPNKTLRSLCTRSIMRGTFLRKLVFILAILAWPAIGRAQEALLTGTVTDSTGGVLPGVSVRAVHTASGNNFETVTDERGTFRLAVRTGAFTVTTTLQGFATVTRMIELLVGQQAQVNIPMAPSGVQE